MRAVLQRATAGWVVVDGMEVGRLDPVPGLVILLGVAPADGEAEARLLADKIAGLRIFEDDQGKMNLSLRDVGGGALVVSQFTLYADVRKGRRPSFVHAAPPEVARPLVERLAEELRSQGLGVASGEFGAHMLISLINDGPVTIWIDSQAL